MPDLGDSWGWASDGASQPHWPTSRHSHLPRLSIQHQQKVRQLQYPNVAFIYCWLMCCIECDYTNIHFINQIIATTKNISPPIRHFSHYINILHTALQRMLTIINRTFVFQTWLETCKDFSCKKRLISKLTQAPACTLAVLAVLAVTKICVSRGGLFVPSVRRSSDSVSHRLSILSQGDVTTACRPTEPALWPRPLPSCPIRRRHW